MLPLNNASSTSPAYEMDTLGSTPTGTHSVSKSSSASRKGPPSRNDYAIGLVLLFAVVLLWTTSNFVTQASSHTLRERGVLPLNFFFQNLFVNGYEKPFL
jgi:ABC-type Na+ efflux pump permease subunit